MKIKTKKLCKVYTKTGEMTKKRKQIGIKFVKIMTSLDQIEKRDKKYCFFCAIGIYYESTSNLRRESGEFILA